MYSFSQIQTYIQCPLKYRYRYVDKIDSKDFPQTANLLLGKAVHYALEKFYVEYNNYNNLDENQLISVFNNYWNENFSDEIIFDGDIQTFINRGRQYLSDYYNNYAPDGKIRIISTEENIIFNLGEDIKFQGFIDRLDKDGDCFIINDYKTNQSLPSQDKDNYIEQLTLYGLGLQQKYGKYFSKIKARLYYLHFGILDEWEITEDNLKPVVNKYLDIIKTIQDSLFLYNLSNDKYAFMPQESSLCRFCDYKTICPLFVHQSYDDEVVVGESTIREIIDEYVQTSIKLNELDKQKESLKQIIIAYLKDKNVMKLYGNSSALSYSKNIFYKLLDKEKLYLKFQEKGLLGKVLEIDRHKVDRLIKEGEITLGEFNGLIEKSESVTLRTSKK